MLHTLPFKFAAVLIGGVLGALFATLCIRFFETTVSQLGYVAACAIFGGIICAVISTGMSQRSDIFRKFDSPKDLEDSERPNCKRPRPKDSPPLSPH